MSRPLLLSSIMAVALVLVLISQSRLERFIKEEGKLPETAPPLETQAALESQAPTPDEAAPPPAEDDAEAKEKVMASLIETRQSFRTREKTKDEVRADPHTTPPSIMNAAGKLADLVELEQQYPQFKDDFQTFYLECARDEKVITVTRVQCLEKYFLSRQASEGEKVETLKEMPPIVQRLYKELEQ